MLPGETVDTSSESVERQKLGNSQTTSNIKRYHYLEALGHNPTQATHVTISRHSSADMGDRRPPCERTAGRGRRPDQWNKRGNAGENVTCCAVLTAKMSHISSNHEDIKPNFLIVPTRARNLWLPITGLVIQFCSKRYLDP